MLLLDIDHCFIVDFEVMACWDEVADKTDSNWPVAKKVGSITIFYILLL